MIIPAVPQRVSNITTPIRALRIPIFFFTFFNLNISKKKIINFESVDCYKIIDKMLKKPITYKISIEKFIFIINLDLF